MLKNQEETAMTEHLADMSKFVGPVELDPTPFLSESPVFTEALSRQRDLRAQRFASLQEARQVGKALCGQLDLLAAEAGLLRQPATLTSHELFLPSTILNPADGTEYVASVEQEGDVFDPPKTRGLFVGFGASISGEYEAASADGTLAEELVPKLTGAHVSIHYQLQVDGPINMLNLIGGVPCAHAAADASTLEFVADERRRKAAAALGTLTDLPFPEAQFFAHNLDALLEPNERRCHILRPLGQMVRLFVAQHQGEVTERHKDAILDFLQARLGLYPEEPLTVKADYGVSVPKPNGQETIVAKLNLTSSLTDLSFAPHVFYGTTEKVRRGRRAEQQAFSSNIPLSPAMVMPWHDHRTDENTYLQVPFEYLRHLQPQS